MFTEWSKEQIEICKERANTQQKCQQHNLAALWRGQKIGLETALSYFTNTSPLPALKEALKLAEEVWMACEPKSEADSLAEDLYLLLLVDVAPDEEQQTEEKEG